MCKIWVTLTNVFSNRLEEALLTEGIKLQIRMLLVQSADTALLEE